MEKGYIRINPCNNRFYIGKYNPPQVTNSYLHKNGEWAANIQNDDGRFTTIEDAVNCCKQCGVEPIIDQERISRY